jgi:hypothetical protein
MLKDKNKIKKYIQFLKENDKKNGSSQPAKPTI